MPLGLNQLRVFEAVTRCGSFVKAADRLAVTPPAVSLQIHQLERACGVARFERVGRRVRLTSAGEVLQDYAARIFASSRTPRKRSSGVAASSTRGFVCC